MEKRLIDRLRIREIGEGKRILLIPIVILFVMAMVQLYGLLVTDSPYTGKVILVSISLMIIWIVPCFFKKGMGAEAGTSDTFTTIIAILIAILLAAVFSCFVWGRGYLSLSPIAKINRGMQHADNLFHSAIAESFGRSMFPSALVNEEKLIHYHTFYYSLP